MIETRKRWSHPSLCFILILVVLAIPLVLSGATQAENAWVKWERIEGVTVSGNAITNRNVVAGVKSVGFSWSTTKGKARINLLDGKITFRVKGLVLASQNPEGGPPVIGTPSPVVKAVKGTIVCNAAEPSPFSNVALFDTDAVPLSPQGDAQFHGEMMNLPVVCDDMVFLIRVATPGLVFDQWIAYGAVRTP